jgi:hypothetical protein
MKLSVPQKTRNFLINLATGLKVRTGFIWVKTEAELLLSSQGGLCSMELVNVKRFPEDLKTWISASTDNP